MKMDPSPRVSHDEDQDDQDTQEDQEEKDGNDNGSESNCKPDNSPGEMFRTAVSSLKKMRHTQKLTFECSQKMDHLMVFRQQCTCQLVSHGMKQHLKQLLENDLIEDLHPQVIDGTCTLYSVQH